MSNNTNTTAIIANSDKELSYFNNIALPKFVENTPMKRGTPRDFLDIARLDPNVWEQVIKGAEKPDKINWRSVAAWNRKWRRKYSNYYDYLKVASRGHLKKNER